MAENEHIGGRFGALESAAIRVHFERCAKVRNRNVSCLRCAEVCTSGCITVDAGELSIDASRCVGCGTCASVCPTCALEARNPCDAELSAHCLRAVRGGEVYIACAPYRDALAGKLREGEYAEVVCLGRVEESLLCTLAAHGVKRVHLLCGDCDKCAQRHGRAAAYEACKSAKSLLAAWNAGAEMLVEPGVAPALLADGVEVVDAQHALEAAFSAGVSCTPLVEQGDGAPTGEAAELSLQHVMDDGTLPHFLPDRRDALLDALADLGEPGAGRVSSRLWGCVAIDGSKCVSCRMCATFCPTDAISRYDEEDGSFGVEHFPADCVRCGSCRDICPANAITIYDEVPVSYILGSSVHRFPMRSREVALDGVHQIKNTVARYIDGDVFER